MVYLLAIFAKLTASQLAEVFNRYPLDRYAQRCIEDSVVVPQLADKLSRNPELRPSQIDKLLAHLGAENVIYLLLHLREESVWDRVVSYCDLKERAQVEISGHDLKQLGLWDEVMIADLKYFDGTLAKIDRIPAELRSLYATAFEVEPGWLIEAASRRQKWIDQAQSLNIYMAGVSGRKLDETYKLAWLRGLKTTYYLRTMGATSAEKSTGRAGALNAVPTAGGAVEETQFCSIDNPECEACQ